MGRALGVVADGAGAALGTAAHAHSGQTDAAVRSDLVAAHKLLAMHGFDELTVAQKTPPSSAPALHVCLALRLVRDGAWAPAPPLKSNTDANTTAPLLGALVHHLRVCTCAALPRCAACAHHTECNGCFAFPAPRMAQWNHISSRVGPQHDDASVFLITPGRHELASALS